MGFVNLTEAKLSGLAVHKVGHKIKNDPFVISDDLVKFDDIMEGILLDFFTKSFKTDSFYKFHHETELSQNVLYNCCYKIFNGIGTADLLEQSAIILEHLHSYSVDPHIKGGELFVAQLSDCIVDNNSLKAVGIFKSENKDIFLQFEEGQNQFNIDAVQGVSTRRLDKGCIVFNTFAEDGFSVLMVDRGSDQGVYWRDEFLNIIRIQDYSYQTEAYMELAKDFCDEVVAQDTDSRDQVVFMNKAYNYFQRKEVYDADDFKNEVISEPKFYDQFDAFKTTYEEEQGLESGEGFPISKYAVRSKKKEFPNQIKLDTQIEIKLNSRHIGASEQFLERGFDEQRGMHFYKIYFNDEENL